MDIELLFEWYDCVKLRTLGTGTFGRVKLVQHKPTVRLTYTYTFIDIYL